MGTHLKNLEAALSKHDTYTINVQIVKLTPQFRGFIRLRGEKHLYDRDDGGLGEFISVEYPDARGLGETIESRQQ